MYEQHLKKQQVAAPSGRDVLFHEDVIEPV